MFSKLIIIKIITTIMAFIGSIEQVTNIHGIQINR